MVPHGGVRAPVGSLGHMNSNGAVVNATDTEQKFDLNVSGMKVAGPSTQWQLSGTSLNAENHVGQPAQIQVKEISLGDAPSSITVTANSVNIYRLPVAGQ